MVTNLPGKPKVSDIVFSKIHKGAAILNVAELYPFTGSQEAVFYNFNASDAEFHDGATDTLKNISNDQLDEVTIRTNTLYKWLEFSDTQYKDRRIVANAIENKSAEALYRTLDKVAVRGQEGVPTSGFTGYTTPELTVDETSASWLAAIDSVSLKGYRPSAIIADYSLHATLRAAFVENTMTNQLATSIKDGSYVGDVPIFFRDLGAPVGLVADFSKAVVAYNNTLGVDRYDPKTDAYQGRRNKNAVKISWVVGYGVAVQDAFQPITLTTPTP